MFDVLVSEGVFLKNTYYRVSFLLTTTYNKMDEFKKLRSRFEDEMTDMIGEKMSFTEIDKYDLETTQSATWFRIGGTYYFTNKEYAVHANFIAGIIKNEFS